MQGYLHVFFLRANTTGAFFSEIKDYVFLINNHQV